MAMTNVNVSTAENTVVTGNANLDAGAQVVKEEKEKEGQKAKEEEKEKLTFQATHFLCRVRISRQELQARMLTQMLIRQRELIRVKTGLTLTRQNLTIANCATTTWIVWRLVHFSVPKLK